MLAVGKGVAPKNNFFCSQWVATVLQESNIDIFEGKKTVSIRPFDFYIALKDHIIYEGPVVEYPYYNNLEYQDYVEDEESQLLIKKI